MAFMVWSKEFEIGIPEMDKQHQRWLELLNNFYDRLETSNMKDHLLRLIDEAIDYTQYHFSEEEKLMASIGYPAQNDQKKMHQDIRSKIAEYRQKIATDKPLMSMSVTNEFKGWFTHHILEEDRKYADMYKLVKK